MRWGLLTNLTDDPMVTDCEDGDVRLVGGATPSEGTVELCRNRVWGGICDKYWDYSEANVVCSQLGFLPSGNHLAALSNIHS